MLDNKAPVVLKTENSFGVSNISCKCDDDDNLCCNVSLVNTLFCFHSFYCNEPLKLTHIYIHNNSHDTLGAVPVSK